MKGNTSRNSGFVNKDGTFNAQVHFKVSVNQTFDDAEDNDYYIRSWDDESQRNDRKKRRIGDAKKFDIKYNKNKDNTFTRQIYAYYCYDQEGLLSQKNNLVKVNIESESDSMSYLYELQECIDSEFIERRFSDDEETYIPRKQIVEENIEETVVNIDTVGDLSKTYMDYERITNKSSKQWELLQTLTICDDGMIRDNDGYIAAALGSAFGPIGSRYIFNLEDGKELLIIKVDQKQDSHTCENNIFGLNNWDIIEFVVDTSKMPVWNNGLVYGGNFNNVPEYSGGIVNWVEVY